MRHDPVLQRFSLSEQDLLGQGGESRVYALGDSQVLRVYGSRVDPAYLKRLLDFYRAAAPHKLPFELPLMEEVGVLDGVHYAVERRIRGVSMTQFLLTATGEARRRSIRSYLDAVEHIQAIPIDADAFGELLVADPVRRPTWPAYLLDRARIPQAHAAFGDDVPERAQVAARWQDSLSMVDDVPSPKLVHGDYFPGNVLVDERGEVTAVIDFSPLTVAGDPRLDLIAALIFLEVDDGYQPDDSPFAHRLLEERHGPDLLALEDLYRTYYSLFFAHTKDTDPVLYEWCVANLRKAAGA